MITGFNTDIEHDGVVYHVQTEDKGLDSPLILSLVYSGGAILASKRSPYEDLIASGFDEEALVQRLKHQHRLICAAINAGRIEDLKRMGGGRAGEVQPEPAAHAVETQAVDDVTAEIPRAPQETVAPPAQTTSQAQASPYTVHDSRRQSPLGEMQPPDKALVVTLLNEEEFRAGDSLNLRILVENRSGKKAKPLPGVALSIKILGTGFRPQLYSVKTESDGVAVVSAQIPKFTSGRAAVLILASAEGRVTETRRVIHSVK